MFLRTFCLGVVSCALTGVDAYLITGQTCRPSLPIDWFIEQAQSPPLFSQILQEEFKNATELTDTNLANLVNSSAFDVSALSIVVAGPWGKVYETNLGVLRANDTVHDMPPDGDSIYRIACISKVPPPQSPQTPNLLR